MLLTADLATMLDSFAHNAGFVAVRPTRYSRAVYERVRRITEFSHQTDDQTALNTAIRALNKRSGFSAVMLDKHKYYTDTRLHGARWHIAALFHTNQTTPRRHHTNTQWPIQKIVP